MKPQPAPHVTGDIDAQRMSNALNAVLKVSKADLLKAEEEGKKSQAKKKLAKKKAS